MLSLRQSLRLNAARVARPAVASRGYAGKIENARKEFIEIKEDKEGWTENNEETPSEADVTADNSDAPNKPTEGMVKETIQKIDGKHHGGRGEVKTK